MMSLTSSWCYGRNGSGLSFSTYSNLKTNKQGLLFFKLLIWVGSKSDRRDQYMVEFWKVWASNPLEPIHYQRRSLGVHCIWQCLSFAKSELLEQHIFRVRYQKFEGLFKYCLISPCACSNLAACSITAPNLRL